MTPDGGFGLGLGPDPAVDRKSRVPPGQQPLGPFRAQELPAEKKSQDLPSEYLGQPRVVKRAHPLEDARFVHPALGHQKMQVRAKIDPVP
jgi:hypothetical protein